MAKSFLDLRPDPGDPGYTVQMACGNCSWVGAVTISQGVLVPTRGRLGSRCPNCRCMTLIKTVDQMPRL